VAAGDLGFSIFKHAFDGPGLVRRVDNYLNFCILIPLNWSAELGQPVQIRRWMIANQIDRPCAEQDKRRSDGDDDSTDQWLLPLFLPGIRDQSCVMCIGLLCFRQNPAGAQAD